MDPSRWERAKAVFQEGFGGGPAGLPGFLDEACAGDIELRVEAERLLSAHVRAGGFLEGDPTPLPPRIGPYRVLRELGRGGMGTVYLAERDEPGLRKTVAVKLVRPGMASDVVLRRFQTERQILSALEHPGIARLYDGGTTEAGLPYFVMEHVDGLSL